MSLLSLCALLFRQSRLFLICVVWTYGDSSIIPRKTCRIPRYCHCEWLLVSSSAPGTSLGFSGSREKFLFYMGRDSNHWVAKSCTTTAYRWLFRDSLSSPWIFVIRCDQVTEIFRSGHDPCYFGLQADITIWILRIVRNTLCLPEPGSTFARGSTGSSWDDLDVSWLHCSGFPPRLCWRTFINQILSEFL